MPKLPSTGYGLPDALFALDLALAPDQQTFQTMMGSLMAGMPMGGIPIGDPQGAMLQARAPGGSPPFAFAPGGTRPQGW